MAETVQARKLASIVAIDVAGYSRRTEADEEAAIKAVAALRGRIAATAETHAGRVFNTAGDGFMLEFPTASGALAAAEEIAGAGDPPVRVGVHLGEVSVTESGDLLGHGVNVAARIQQMAQPGAVLASGDVKRAVRGPLGERLKPQGSVRLDKMSETLAVFALAPPEGGRTKGRRFKPPIVAVAVAIAAFAILGLGAWIVKDLVATAPAGERIAIVPFASLGGDEEASTFASSVAEDLANVLSGNGRPIVTGAEAQALTDPHAADRIRKLGVRLMLGGSVERQADQLKVRVRLDDPQHDVTLWTAAVEAPLTQSEQLQGQLGARIIAVLNCTSRAFRPKGGLSDPDALTLLLKACDIFESQGEMGDDSRADLGVLDTCRQLVARAPAFAAGHSLLAKFAAYYRAFLPPGMNDQLENEARAEIGKALRLDPGDIDAHVAQYMLISTGDFIDRDKAIMSVPFDPSWPYGEGFKGVFLADVGRTTEALAAEQRAVAANPLSTDADAVMFLVGAGKTRDGEQELARLSRLWPANFFWVDRLTLYLADDNWSGLETFLDTPSQQPKDGLSQADIARLRLVFIAARTRTPAALARARTALMDVPNGAPVFLGERVVPLAWLGFVDDAFAMASRVTHNTLVDGNSPAVLFYPQAQAMRRDPRFMALAARLGLIDYWTKTGKWPDFCSEPGLPYDCKAEAAKVAAGRAPSR